MSNNTTNNSFWKDYHVLDALRGGGIFLIIKILGTFGAYLFAWYISRNYGPEGNGILAFTLTLAVLLAALYNLGLNTYAVKIIPQFIQGGHFKGADNFYRQALILIRRITLAGSFITLGISYLVSSPSLSRDLFLVSFLSIPVSQILFLSHNYKARKNMVGFSLLQNNLMQIGALLLLLLPFWGGAESTEPVWACVLAGVLMTIIGIYDIKPDKIQKERKSYQSFFSLHLRESLPMLAGGLAFMILNLTDRLMLRFLDSTIQLGIYDIALRLSNISLLGILSLNAMAEPKFAEFFARNEMTGLKRFVGRMTWTGMIISTPVIAVLAIFPDFWLGLFGEGSDYLEGQSTLHILLIGQAVSVFCGAVLVLLNMTGHQRSVQTILVVASLLNIVLNALLIPYMGIDGAAWATVISTGVWNIWAFWVVKNKLGFWMTEHNPAMGGIKDG